jgi:hypothetical protein
VLRYQLRERRVWKSVTSSANTEYRERFYSIPEAESPLENSVIANATQLPSASTLPVRTRTVAQTDCATMETCGV